MSVRRSMWIIFQWNFHDFLLNFELLHMFDFKIFFFLPSFIYATWNAELFHLELAIDGTRKFLEDNPEASADEIVEVVEDAAAEEGGFTENASTRLYGQEIDEGS